ncbi:DUF4012 domain-containing protein [Agromyces humatus]|uniref:DUF4012 domain-containing protein n=1 Tax=Agromyces humatus TaxID=279573 RepID=A0ABN2K8W3_9MICO|nr:DUF4012 domain-containing protein [Agromyces humatus]
MTTRAEKQKRPLIRSARLWVPIGILVVLIGLVVWGVVLANKAFATQAALESAIPLATETQDLIAAGDVEGAKASASQLTEYTAEARANTDDVLWRSAEWVPIVGPNMAAVRVASTGADELVNGAVIPATEISMDALKPQGGAIDVVAVQQLADKVEQASRAIDQVSAELDGVDREALIGPVASGIDRLDEAVGQLKPTLDAANTTLQVLPAALGADGPRNYLMLFQNNAESRGTGGNPAAIVMINVTDGKLTITQQADSGDFNNNRPSPIMELDPETAALYGDKIGRFMPDITLTPDFTESAEIMRAYWAESFGTPIDGVLSFDPVALSYLLGATGPVKLATGETLTADNAVSELLNQVYFRYEPEQQDAFFASAAASIFSVVSSGAGDTSDLVEALARAVDEGRLLYVPSAEAEAALIDGNRIDGKLPADNSEKTMVGVYVNDVTEGKLDYYAKLSVAATSDQCTATEPAFTTTATFASTLDPGAVDGLAEYISPARFFPKGVIATELVLYGPVGSTFTGATVDGAPSVAAAVPHLGRPAVKVPIVNQPGASHTVVANFTGVAGEYGPLEVWHTPMVQSTEVTVETPGC